MPTALSYPGVYIEEVASGVRTITGVPTSIAAFIGRAARGPVNKAITINGFGDFERIFGGLWLQSQLGFAVRDFFLNGGGQAIIVRLFGVDPVPAVPAVPVVPALPVVVPVSIATLSAGGLQLVAASEGRWGGNLRAVVDKDGLSDDVAFAMGVAKVDLFNLTLRDAGPGGSTERYTNLTVKESARRIDRVLAAQSSLARWSGTLDPKTAPAATAGSDAVSGAEKTVADKKKDLALAQVSGVAETIKTAKAALSTAQTAADAAKKLTTDAVSDGGYLKATDFLPDKGETTKHGLYALDQADLFNLLCIPPYATTDEISFDADPIVVSAATAYCEKRRAIHLIDPPSAWTNKDDAKSGIIDFPDARSRNAALYFPRLKQPNLLRENRIEVFAPCGVVAGVIARTDTQRGVWKAPAGLDATLSGVPQLAENLTDAENGELNPLGINCLRGFSAAGRVVWGSRTLRGADQLADEWKYLPVRRTALFIEESLYRGTQWVVFEPNDEPLWSQIRLNVGAFMHGLFRQGAFQGQSPRDAYFVKCDKETTTQTDIDSGIVNIAVGFAPLKPAEFVVIRLQQIAGQIQT
jgi:phage tail sheath protein FI